MDGIVNSCPLNLTSTQKASTRLGCGRDKYGNDQYMCLPNVEKTGLVEFCHNKIMGITYRGYCLETVEGKLSRRNCSDFRTGCPDNEFHINEMYKYPACLRISTQHQCYLADPSCGNVTRDATSESTPETFSTGFTTDHGIYNMTSMNIQTTALPEVDSANIGAIVGSLVAVMLILVLVLIIFWVVWRRKQRQKQWERDESGFLLTTKEESPAAKASGMDDINTKEQNENEHKFEARVYDTDIDSENEPLLSPTSDGTTKKQERFVNNEPEEGEHGVPEAGVNDSETESDRSSSDSDEGIELERERVLRRHRTDLSLRAVGEYNLWKTELSDQFSTLTDDEVFVLFCYLCSYSGPPDFTDTEWLYRLNEIREVVFCKERVYHKEDPVTSEEAQQTLDRLKSRDFLWEDQDKIKEDIKDETMYKIASKDDDIPFDYSSYDTASVYLRSRRYSRKPGEKCVITNRTSTFMGGNDITDSLLIRRLQMNILTHVTMEDTNIYDMIYQNLNVPENILKDSKDKQEEFLIDLRKGGEAVHYRGRSQDSVQHVTWLWTRPDIVRSCIGLHPHNDIYIIDNKAYRKPSKYHNYSPDVRCLLYSLLLVEKYQLNINEQSHKIKRDKIKDRYFTDSTDDNPVNLPDGITETHNGVIKFISVDIRHEVMYAFVTECLVEDSDLEFFLNVASLDVISEYCRSYRYQRSKGERCLYVPREMYGLFIDRLQLDIITHCTVSDWWIHDSISKCLGVPEEILKWDQEARERYVEYAKRGTQTVHHARGMIVGCAGAGKTTLLKRLLGCSEEEIKAVKSTKGLEVHEEIFEVCDETKSLKARMQIKDDKNEINSAGNVDAKTLSFFDFGGQCAYYACHQIYLTRRAFYVVVVDASKRLDQKVDKKVCDQDGSVFSGWTYGDYFVFWIKSIHTYCSSENEKDQKPIVQIVATHWEKGLRQFENKDDLMESLRHQLSESSTLTQYITKDNCHCTHFSLPIHDIERCFFDIACYQRWKESIPKEWSFLGIEINQKKHSKRILNISEIKTEVPGIFVEGKESPDNALEGKQDMLRYYHDAGKALYFNEVGLDGKVIIDVQWFIDAFKHIITDELHFKGMPVSRRDWDEYYKTGNLQDHLLIEIWKHRDEEIFQKLKTKDKKKYNETWSEEEKKRYLQYHKVSLLNFMQRLGLLAIGTRSHYVPCMNRKEMEKELPDLINKSESKTAVLIYQFEFLPFFLYFRLIVACMQEKGWTVLENKGTSCLYRNAALFSYTEYYVVLSVTEESIQLQVFHPVPGSGLEREKTCSIQERVEDMLNNFAGTFHKKIQFVRGFRCRMDQNYPIAMDIKGHFLQGNKILKEDREMRCPLHPITDYHFINTTEFTRYWKL